MKCINFDQEFQRYLHQWGVKNSKKYQNVEAMENAMPDVYAQFLDTPADFLAGIKPGEYFEAFSDPRQLVNWMEDYYKQRIPVPDPLLNRISSLGSASEEALMNTLTKEKAKQEAKMCAISLLREIDSLAPMQFYIQLQINRSEQDELADAALESLQGMGESAVPQMRAAITAANRFGQESLLSVLCNYGFDEALFDIALNLLSQKGPSAPVIADYISRLGDDRALELLTELAMDEETVYLDYIEYRAAIERLGGEPPERKWDSTDPAYEALRRMQ